MTMYPGVALDESDVGQRLAANLVDAVGHLEQAAVVVEQRMAPEARMHRLRRFAVQKVLERLVVPDGRRRRRR